MTSTHVEFDFTLLRPTPGIPLGPSTSIIRLLTRWLMLVECRALRLRGGT
jgi:hypothetical protein